MRVLRIGLAVAACAVLAGCGSGPPRYTPQPTPEPPPLPLPPPPSPDIWPLAGDPLVRVGIHWDRSRVRIDAPDGLLLRGGSPDSTRVRAVELSARGDQVVARCAGQLVDPGTAMLRVETDDSLFACDGKVFRGRIEASARADSLFVVNVVPLEAYLRGVVPGEIGAHDSTEREAIAAQAVAARTYTVKRFGQYGSLPFDLFSSVQDQLYEGVSGELPLSDAAVRETRGLVIADNVGLLEAYYSSTCGGYRGDIATVWPWREMHPALRGGPDGPEGQEWCRDSKYFAWEEHWTGATLSRLVREQIPVLLDLPSGSVRGALTDIRVTRRDASGRAAQIQYVTTEGSWTVLGDKNRWVLRRPEGAILRSTRLTLRVRAGARGVESVVATGGGNGHGVGMCQMGAKARARSGATFREILDAYYPGTRIRALLGSDLPPGRGDAS